MMRTVRLRIAGRVQGVGYRDFVRCEAQARALTGWVRNCRNGAVEALVSGAADAIDEFIAACWQGPPAARVADIRIEQVPAGAEPLAAGFAIRPTA